MAELDDACRLAARLMAASIDVATDRGRAAVWLGVNQHNARANRFYEKQGFAVVGTKTFTVGNQTFASEVVRERVL